MTYAKLNKASTAYAWLGQLFKGDRVPLVSTDLIDSAESGGLTNEDSYIVALDELDNQQRATIVDHFVARSNLTRQEIETVFDEIGGCPIPVDAVTITTAQTPG